MPDSPSCHGLLYCNCTYAQVIDPAVKAAVLRQLLDSGRSFEAVADLCEMSARRDPALERLARGGTVKIAACYPRAVKWLFASAGAPLAAGQAEVLNLREASAEAVVERLFAPDVRPNLPTGKPEAAGGTRPDPAAHSGDAGSPAGNPEPTGVDRAAVTTLPHSTAS